METKKQTGVEWLKKKLFNEFGFAFSDNILNDAKEIEKQNIINAYNSGTFYIQGDEYYEKTFEIENECNFNYYEIRAGKCEFAKVVKGKILCDKKCKQN